MVTLRIRVLSSIFSLKFMAEFQCIMEIIRKTPGTILCIRGEHTKKACKIWDASMIGESI
jgi:hypothetical protein